MINVCQAYTFDLNPIDLSYYSFMIRPHDQAFDELFMKNDKMLM